MNEIDWLKSLEQKDGRDPGDIDVANSVMRDIRRRQYAPAEDSLALPALFAALAGSAAAIIAIQLSVSDPFNGLLDAFNLVLQ